jgi:hypothetical protein
MCAYDHMLYQHFDNNCMKISTLNEMTEKNIVVFIFKENMFDSKIILE